MFCFKRFLSFIVFSDFWGAGDFWGGWRVGGVGFLPALRLPLKGKALLRRSLLSAEPLASPRGEAVCDSRLMRWHLAFAITSRQRQTRAKRSSLSHRHSAAPAIGAPPHPSRLTPCHLPLKGKALRFCGRIWASLQRKRNRLTSESSPRSPQGRSGGGTPFPESGSGT